MFAKLKGKKVNIFLHSIMLHSLWVIIGLEAAVFCVMVPKWRPGPLMSYFQQAVGRAQGGGCLVTNLCPRS